MPSILVVDDNTNVRQVLQMILEGAGYEVFVAGDGHEAVERYGAHPCDLVILDILMPKKEGLETILELRRDFPEVKIIAVSGGGRVGAYDYMEMARSFGALETLSKPIRQEELLAAVREVLTGPGES